MSKKASHELASVCKPPSGEAWVWHTLALVSSPAWRARSSNLARLIEALEIEHMRHGGAENGFLRQTYTQLEKAGITRKYIAPTIDEGESLGLIEVRRGARISMTESHMSDFRLTYFAAKTVDPGYQGGAPYFSAPTNDWKKLTEKQSEEIAQKCRQKRAMAAGGKNPKRCPKKEPERFPKRNRSGSQKGTAPSETRTNPRVEIVQLVPKKEPPSISWGYAEGNLPAHADWSWRFQPCRA